jgi:aldehyde dehydrogenase (NAD+)
MMKVEKISNTASFKMYINGKWVKSGSKRIFEHRNPARLSQVTGLFPMSTPEDSDHAITAAQEAFPDWRATPPNKRMEILKKVLIGMGEKRNDLARVLTIENGKTLAESQAEIDSAIEEMDFQIAEGLRAYGETVQVNASGVLAYSIREPLGVVGIITPWNFPLNVPVRKCTPALVAGNTCVFKPASLTPQTGLRFVELFQKAGLPPGVLNVVIGSGQDVGDAIVTDPRIKAISFTGSTEVGIGIHKKIAQNLTRSQLELGGKNPVVVLEDANMDDAVNAILKASYACAGQWCTSTSRAIVIEEIAGEFIERVLEKVKKIRVGNGLDEGVDMGPVCGKAQMEHILSFIEKGKQEGAQILLGGGRLNGPQYDDGCFIAPTVFSGVKPNMTIAREEIFGPVLSIMVVKDFDRAVEMANGVRFGLSSSIFTNDLSRALSFLEQTKVGLTHVNLMTSFKEPQLSFGGIKESGFGIPEAGKTGIEFFTEHKVAYIKYR